MSENSMDSATRFLSSALHEIRTPIQTIISTTELLSDTKLTQEQNEYLRQIEFSANVLLQLANNVLDFAKINSNKFTLENIPYNVIDLCERVVDLVSIEAFNSGVEIVTDIDYSMPEMVTGDPTRVQQILLNLVKNAVKFTKKGSILVKLSQKSGSLHFEVSDTGIGIPLEKQALIFNQFYQVDSSTTRKFGGSGLGLTISKHLVEIMHGTIGVRSNPENGSTFWFKIPLEKAPIESDSKEEFSFSLEQRILLVDDSELALSAFVNKLSTLGINNIEVALNASVALQKIQSAQNAKIPFNSVYIDMIMPNTNGGQLVTEIKKLPYAENLKLYLMIPEGQVGISAKINQLDLYNGYIYKPIKFQQLLQILQEKPIKNDSKPKNDISTQQINSQTSAIASGSLILVAEDHPVNRKIIATFLQKFGAKVLLAEDGEQAVQQIKAHPNVDMIFMDILMPVKSGIDATIELRNSLQYKGIIVACTANNDTRDFEEYRRLGINDILVKPFKRGDVAQMLEKWNTVLSLPEAKKIMNLTNIKNSAEGFWDVVDFMDTVEGDKELARTIMTVYVEQTQDLLAKIQTELSLPNKNFVKLEELAHTLKGSSATVSAKKLAKSAKEMNDACKTKDLVAFEAARTEFCLDFVTLNTLINNWKSSL